MSDHLLPRGDSARAGSNRRRSRPSEEPVADGAVPRVVSRVEMARAGSSDLVSSKPPLPNQSASSTAWQYTSTQRCLACGTLGCTECATRLDPQARRQRLEALKMNTPYERAKIQRVVEDVRTDEARRRGKVEEQWFAELRGMQLMEMTRRRLVSLAQLERAYREDVHLAEAHERRQWKVAAEMHAVLAALVCHEKEARCALTSVERTDFSTLAYQYECHRHLAAWARREAAARERLALDEGAARDRLHAVEADGRHVMRSQQIEQMALQEQCLAARDAVHHEWRAGLEQLADLAAAHVSVVNEQAAERMELLAEAERGAVNVAREREFALGRLYDDMMEEAALIEETAQLFAHQKANLFNMESAARNGLVEEWVAFQHAVCLQVKQDEERVFKWLRSKIRAREQALHEATRHLEAIVAEEVEAFSTLILEERRERSQRENVMSEKACVREEFVRRCLASAYQLQQEEEQARRALSQYEQRDVVGVADWMAHKERQRVELLALACNEKVEITKDEHQAYFFILASMAQHEEGVRRWCARKVEEQDEAAAQESEQRQQIICLEELARETVAMLLRSHVERLTTQARQRTDQLETLERQHLAAADGIRVEEADARRSLAHVHLHGLALSVKATEYREQLQLLQRETVRRSFLAQEEISSRDAIGVQASLSYRLHEERAMALHQERVHELESAEYSDRHLVYAEVEEFYEYVSLQQRREEIALLQQLEDQIAQQLAARQVYMEEDARLYDEMESLVFSASPARDADAAEMDGATEAQRQMSDLKAQLVLQTLGNPTCTAAVKPVCIEYLAAVLNLVGTRRAEVTDHVSRLERESQLVQKKVQSIEVQLLSERDKKDDYETRRGREVAERERRLENDQLEKKREMERWAAEKRRLKEAEEALAAQKNALDALRQSIHSQYKH